MSKLSDLGDAGRADVIPGYIVSKLRLPDYGLAESAFARWYMSRVVRVACETRADPHDRAKRVPVFPPAMQEKAIELAQREVGSGWFNFSMPGFDLMAKSSQGLSLILWLSLRIKHPDVTRAKARELMRTADEVRLTEALFEAMGFTAVRKKKAANRSKPPSPSSGEESSTTSDVPPPAADAA